MEQENSLPVEEYAFTPVKLETIQKVLQENLIEYFADVNVEIIDCPDLSVPPFNLAVKGFGEGVTGILDLGGIPYLIPVVDKTKVYDLAKIAYNVIGTEGFPNGHYISGSGAGPWFSQGSNCELVANMLIGTDGKVLENKSRVVLTTKLTEEKDKSCNDVTLRELDKEESRCALMINAMVSSGIPGKILRIKCSKRIDASTNLTDSIRDSLVKEFATEPIGLGGLFMIQNSKSKTHVMPEFDENPLVNLTKINNWLRFFEMDPPMLFQSILVSADPGLDLRIEHSHGWSLNGKSEGGHYHHDTSPETVEYVAYYAVAQKLWRIDKPKVPYSTNPE